MFAISFGGVTRKYFNLLIMPVDMPPLVCGFAFIEVPQRHSGRNISICECRVKDAKSMYIERESFFTNTH